MTVTVRPVEAADRERWEELYTGYAEYYRSNQDAEMRDRVFSWLMDDAAQSRGLVAVDEDGRIVGIAHYRPFARPLSATTGCYLDDLFVDPEARGHGAADELLAELRRVAAREGWSVVRWITREDNYRARGKYDLVAERTSWVTYDMKPEA